jgi:rSAM/selenodomain-associated transferase 1
MMRPLVILFAKAPFPGRVKTRLQPFLSAEQACALHEAMVWDALEMLVDLSVIADVELHTDVPTESWPVFPYPRQQQPSGDLGCRLHDTLRLALESGRPRAVILGSDSPGMPASQVRSLLVSDTDVKLGPTEDGGFYGISAKRTTPGMFKGVRWSTPSTCADTQHSLQKSGLSVEVGDRWFDIDEPQDLKKLSVAKTLGRHTAAWLSDLSPLLRASRRH